MIVGPEDKKLFLILVPIPADSAKHARPVMQCVRHHAYLGFTVRNDPPFEKRIIRQWHELYLPLDSTIRPMMAMTNVYHISGGGSGAGNSGKYCRWLVGARRKEVGALRRSALCPRRRREPPRNSVVPNRR